MTCIVRGPSPSLSATSDLILATTKINNLQVMIVVKKYIKHPIFSKLHVKSFNKTFR